MAKGRSNYPTGPGVSPLKGRTHPVADGISPRAKPPHNVGGLTAPSWPYPDQPKPPMQGPAPKKRR